MPRRNPMFVHDPDIRFPGILRNRYERAPLHDENPPQEDHGLAAPRDHRK
jgi:hypothetical protein